MARWIVSGLAVLFLVLTGCQNYPGNAGCASGLMIPPPPTYSPRGTVGQNPYYNGGRVASGNTGLLNPSGTAPTSATQAGWKSANGQDFSLDGNNNQQRSNSVLQRNQIQRTVQPINTAQPPSQGSGASYRRSPNYRSTSVDESTDLSRTVLTDASGVRAPVLTSVSNGLTRVSTGTPVRGVVQGQVRRLNTNPNPNPGFRQFTQTPRLVQGPGSVTTAAFEPNPQRVQSQSTATFTPAPDGDYRNGWNNSRN